MYNSRQLKNENYLPIIQNPFPTLFSLEVKNGRPHNTPWIGTTRRGSLWNRTEPHTQYSHSSTRRYKLTTLIH